MLAFFAFTLAMFISILLIPPLMRSANRLAFVDMPSARKIHGVPVPRIGGLAMVVGALAPILLWIEPSREVLGLVFGIGIILVFGLWDDRSQLNYRVKFGGQLLAIGVAVLYGGIRIHYVPFGGIDPIPEAASILLSMFALIGVTNAINLADGLDGLAAGTTLLSIGAVSLLAYLAGDTVLPVIGMAVMGAIVGFLRFNTYPAQVFMGDAGSQFLGFTAGALVIMLTQQVSTVMSPAMPLLLLGLPLIDTFVVMGQRILERRSPFKPDRNHFHHKLLALGLDHYAAVVVIYGVQAILVALAFVFRYNSDLLNMSLFAMALVSVGGIFVIARRAAPRFKEVGVEILPSRITRLSRAIKQREIMTKWPMYFAAASLTLFFTGVVCFLPTIPADGYLISFVMWGGALVAFGLRRRWREIALIERMIMYVGITTFVFYWCAARPAVPVLAVLENAYFVVLGLSLLIAYRFSRPRDLGVTPTDFLIVLIALMVPTFAHALLPQPYIAEVGIKALVGFYALELIIATAGFSRWWIRPIVAGLLSILSIRVLLGHLPIAM